MSTNTAAWLPANGRPLEVGPAPMPHAGRGELVVRVEAVAVNPVDWIVQSIGAVGYRWLHHPAVLGSDVAGTVQEVGADVTRFRVGDRVLGLAIGLERDRDRPAEGGFQSLVVLSQELAAPVPADMDAVHASVVPLTVSTAATGLFEPKHLGLRLPGAGEGGTVVVWGAATAVGASAVQLARAAGYAVIATASPANAALVRSLGAEAVVDRRDRAAVDRVLDALDGRRLDGVLAVGTGSAAPCAAIAVRAEGARSVASASTAVSFDGLAPGRGVLLRAVPLLARMAAGETAVRVRARRSGVRLTTIWGSDLRHSPIGPAIWRDFLPAALADGTFRPVPEPVVVGAGLVSLQAALDRQRRGVSAQKLVVTL